MSAPAAASSSKKGSGASKDKDSFASEPGDLSHVPTPASIHKSQQASSGSSHSRTYAEDCQYLKRIDDTKFEIKIGFVPNMKVPGYFYVNKVLEPMMFEELRAAGQSGGVGGFLPAVKQIANVASLPGIVGASIGLPDVHSGYGFAIGNVAAFDMDDPTSIVSPGGVGFDINCGVRLIRTNLHERDVRPIQEKLTQSLFDHIPVGVGSKGVIPTRQADLIEALEMGMDWSLREGYAWAEDKEHCEEFGRMLSADPSKVSARAKKRGLPQLGTLGAGNHYCEVQIVEEIFDQDAASKMGIEFLGQVVIMVHSGSRGLGHQVATDALTDMERAMARDGIYVNDKQLACARIQSKEGQDYLAAMAAAANYAFVNRSSMTFLVRQTFAKMFETTPDDLDMHVIYDVSHNIAKVEEHVVNGERKRLLVHRKGSCFPTADHEILTTHGFMSHAAVVKHFQHAPTLSVACYVDGSLEYHDIQSSAVTFIQGATHDLVHMEATTVEAGGVSDSTRRVSNGVSITVTDNHRMWMRVGHKYSTGGCRWVRSEPVPDFDIHLAGDVLSRSEDEAELATQLQACFENGFRQASDGAASSSTSGAAKSRTYAAALGLVTKDEELAFLELYGYWLGDGWLDGRDAKIMFGPKKRADWVYLDALFARLSERLPRYEVAVPGAPGVWRGTAAMKNGQLCFAITDSNWWKYFSMQYGHTATSAPPQAENINSPKWLWNWVMQLDKDSCALLLRGLAMADGLASRVSLESGTIYTASARFRDEIVHLCLHAGFSVTWGVDKEKGQVTTHKDGRDVIATDTTWEINYTAQSAKTQPWITPSEELRSEKNWHGDVWCVTVPTAKQLIMVRRVLEVEKDRGDVVRKASRPVVVGNTRAFPPHHPLIPVDYQLTGQPVLIGGSMGTNSYVLTGTAKGMAESFGSTCHGAGRAMSRNKSRRALDYKEVLEGLAEKGISIRVASPKLVMEEAPESYKDVTQVVDTCHDAGISKKCIKLRPIAVVKG